MIIPMELMIHIVGVIGDDYEYKILGKEGIRTLPKRAILGSEPSIPKNIPDEGVTVKAEIDSFYVGKNGF